MSIDIFIDISIDILIDTLIDIFFDISIDIFIGICIDILTDKEEGRGGKEWRSEGVDFFLKSNNPTPEGGELIACRKSRTVGFEYPFSPSRENA